MSRRAFSASVTCCVVLPFAACSGSNGSGVSPAGDTRLVVAATTTVLEPSAAPFVFDPASVGAERVDAYYRLTTPANTPLRLELASWAPEASGATAVAVDHVRDGGAVPPDDVFSLGRAGLLATGNGMATDGRWTAANGDGFARLSVTGQVERDQRLVVRGEGTGVVLVDLVIGAPSEINRPGNVEPDAPGVVSRTTLYSSLSWQFGLPTVAVSGDRTSIVCYEGDVAQPNGQRRYELRLQHDAQSGAVTGGATIETSADSGQWRDHEIVALYNVLGVVRSEEDGVRVRLSFDRGATFAQDVQVLPTQSRTRLVQAAMAGDYTLAVAAWRFDEVQQTQEFVFVEGRPVAFDGFGSPTWFEFGVPEVLHTVAGAAMPLTTGIAWSEGGDLAIGYGANIWPGFLEARSAVRPYGGQWRHQLVDRAVRVWAFDPAVAVTGYGASLRVFYAFEAFRGIGVYSSDDGGLTFTQRATVGSPGDHLPSIFARDLAGATRVDVLYLAPRALGIELHRAVWPDWASEPREQHALTRASLEQVPSSPASIANGLPPTTTLTTMVGWFGYDAVLDGGQIVVAYDEHRLDMNEYLSTLFMSGMVSGPTTTGGIVLPPTYSNATPPPLAPGLTLPMAAPNPAHPHQLKLLRLQ
jgi:hypothetical protein